MGGNSSSLRAWAARLLSAAELPAGESSRPQVNPSQRLREYLARIIGPDGFTALLRRAVLLSQADIPSLQTVRVTADGHLEGIEPSSEGTEGETVIIAHLLALLIALIGESLTFRLMLNLFPDAPYPSIGEAENLS